jgi:ubiquinone biosynthesis protein COQ9
MDDDGFDQALIGAAFNLAAEHGWRQMTIAGAASAAGLPLARARARFPHRAALLLRFGRLADQAALAELSADGPVRDRLFDLIMRRIDALQTHRAGVLAVMRALPREPTTTLLLACATRRSMRWFLNAVGVGTAGVRGELRLRGLVGVWLWTLRTWERDESSDLSTTMASLDSALNRAERAVRWLHGRPRGEASEKKPPEGAEQPADTEAPPENPSP